MRYSQNLFLVALLLFVASCKQSNFQTKKYLDLKKLESSEENVQSETNTLKDDQQFGTATYAVELDKSDLIFSKDEVQEPIQTENVKSKDSDESDQIVVEENANRSIPETLVKQNHIYKPKPLFLDDDVDPEIKKLENFILLSLIGATVFTVSGLILGFLALFASSGIGLVLAMVALILLAMTCGILSHVNAMKLRRKSNGTRRNIWVIMGIVGGWIWFGIAGIYGLNLLVQYLLF